MMIIGSVVLVALIVFLCVKSREHFTNTEQGGPFKLGGGPFKLRNLTMHYGAVPSNPDSVPNKTWAEYERLSSIPSTEIPYNEVLPDMMHLPPLRDIYNKPVWAQTLDPISGIPESMYTSPRVPLSDFTSETTRDYQIYE